MLDKIRELLFNLRMKYLHILLLILFLSLLLSVLYYVYVKMTLKKTNNTRMKYDLDSIQVKIVSVNPDLPDFKYLLRDYYIASSYNSCCGGNFKNDYVDYTPLKQVIKQGARLLDFEVYNIDNRPVVAASATSAFCLKGTYNSLPFDEVMEVISRYALSSSTAPNPNDPLFLYFRVKSNDVKLYSAMAKSLTKHFKQRMLGPEYQHEGNGENLTAYPLSNYLGKVVIMCDNKTNNFRENKEFETMVNFTGNSVFMRELRYYDVKYSHTTKQLTLHNKKNMSIVVPDLTAESNNVSAALANVYGCQFVCMNYQTFDDNLGYYLELFNDAGSAFILKPKNLRYVPVTIPKPTPQAPENSYAPRKNQKPYYKFLI